MQSEESVSEKSPWTSADRCCSSPNNVLRNVDVDVDGRILNLIETRCGITGDTLANIFVKSDIPFVSIARTRSKDDDADEHCVERYYHAPAFISKQKSFEKKDPTKGRPIETVSYYLVFKDKSVGDYCGSCNLSENKQTSFEVRAFMSAVDPDNKLVDRVSGLYQLALIYRVGIPELFPSRTNKELEERQSGFCQPVDRMLKYKLLCQSADIVVEENEALKKGAAVNKSLLEDFKQLAKFQAAAKVVQAQSKEKGKRELDMDDALIRGSDGVIASRSMLQNIRTLNMFHVLT